MSEFTERIKSIEDRIEKALWDLEMHGELEKALAIYLEAEASLMKFVVHADHPAYAEQQRVLSYCLMRQGNLLRQMGKPQEALALSAREITAARASGDEIALARSLMSNGTNLIVSGKLESGLQLLEEAQALFERGATYDHKQGLGWCWILQADLANTGLIEKEPAEVVEFATHALQILAPIENWPGVARAYSARAVAREKLGDVEGAQQDRQEQKTYEDKGGQEGSPD